MREICIFIYVELNSMHRAADSHVKESERVKSDAVLANLLRHQKISFGADLIRWRRVLWTGTAPSRARVRENRSTIQFLDQNGIANIHQFPVEEADVQFAHEFADVFQAVTVPRLDSPAGRDDGQR